MFYISSPAPIYPVSDLLRCLEQSTEEIAHAHPGALIVVAGDMNTLPEIDIIDATGLTSIVNIPTRGNNMLDRIYVSDPTCYEHIKVVKSSVKSDDSAIIAYNLTACGKTSVVHTYRKKIIQPKS